ncbi:Spore coat protein a, partial [Globisporangium splendens]
MVWSTAVTALAALSAATHFSATEALNNLKESWDAYVSPLVIPEVIDMTAGGSLDMQIGVGRHNWTADGSIAGDIYGYARTNSTPTFPGPTIKVAKGVPISVRWFNMLSAPHLLDDSVEKSLAIMESGCYPYCGVPVVVHVHGLESPAKYDGLPTRSIYQNQSQDMVYLNNQSASTKLYHDHANGLTRLNVWAGLAGMYIIEDKEREAALNMTFETDVPLVLGDRLISNTGVLLYSDDNCLPAGSTVWVPESFGSVNTVNGVVMPYLEVPNAQARFRILNTANARHYNLTIPFADKCQVVARDSGFVGKPEAVDTYMVIFPFERVELVCDFSNDADGTTYELIDNQTADQPTPYDPRVMEFRVKTSLKTSTMVHKEIPSVLTQYKDLKSLWKELGGKQRSVILGEMEYALHCPLYSMIRYRNQEINMTTIKSTLACTKGKVERWTFKNPTDDPHPFHWHLVNAQCGPTDDEVDTNSLKDVVPIPNADTRPSDTITQVCYVACTPDEFLIEGSTRGPAEYNFDTSEPYVAHCHILEHEENSMMSYFKLDDVDDSAPDDNGITPSTTNKITSSVVWTAMGMSVLGGFATTASVLVISVERLMFLANPRSLSIAFALSAGVMVYIAFADMYTEAVTYYRAAFTTGGIVDPEAYEHGGSTTSAGTCGKSCNGNAWLAATGSFMGGVIIILVVEYLVHVVFAAKDEHDHSHGDVEVASPAYADKASLVDAAEKGITTPVMNSPAANPEIMNSPSTAVDSANLLDNAEQRKEYRRAGMMTGIAIAIHNFPEGLALFVSSLQGLRTGIVLSIGIILHNLPEGVAVAAPVYYATGSKLEAFKWTSLSGIAQPIGAAIGWLAVSGGMDYALEATLYAVTAGMLVCITVKELLPGAYRFDPAGKYFVVAFFSGVLIIAFSLIVLNYAGSS